MLKRMHAWSRPLFFAGLFILVSLMFSVRLDAAAQSPTLDPTIHWLFNAKANSDTTSFGQHEPHLAISRTDPNVVVAVAKDYRHNNSKEVWIYVSQDGGLSWPLGLQLHIPGLPADVPNQSDPVTMARDDGRIYAMALGYDANTGNGHGIFVTWTDDNGNTWRNPSIAVTHNQTFGGLDDKEWFAIDNTPTSPYYHNMYVAWATGGIQYKRSIDEGLNWTTDPILIAPGNTEYPFPVVGPDGTLYVFYMDGWGSGADGDIKFVKSTDGGLIFSGPYQVAPTSQPNSPIHGSSYDQFRFFSIITAAVNPTNPNDIWAGWTDDNGIFNGKTDVLYVHSSDGGTTWSDPARLSHDDPEAYTDHITPVFSMGLDGRLHAFWLDRRADPNNQLWHGYHTSTLDGITWEDDTQVSQQAFNLNLGFPPGSGNAAGDYWGLDTVGNIVMAAWNTTVINSQQDIFVAAGVYSTSAVTLTGQVVDAHSLLPLADVQVALDSVISTTTGASGTYTMTVDPGMYTATATLDGYFPQVAANLPLWYGTVTHNFQLQPEVTLTGVVSDAVTSLPIAGAELLLDTGAYTYTNASGSYSFVLPPGIYAATASADGYDPVTVSGIELVSGAVAQDFALQPSTCPLPEILSVAVDAIDPLTFSFSPTVSSTLPVGYLWSFGDGATSTDPAPTHTYPDFGPYTVSLQVTNTCGTASWSRLLQLDRFIFLPLVSRVTP